MAPSSLVPTSSKSRRQLIWLRRGRIVFDAIIGAAAVILLAAWQRAAIPHLANGRLPVLLSVGILAAGLSCLLGRGRCWAFLGIRHFISYPPIWLAGLLGAGLAFLSIGYLRDVRIVTGIEDSLCVPLLWSGAICVGSALVFILVPAVAHRFASSVEPSLSNFEEHLNSPPSYSTFAQLQQWLEDDKPLTRASDAMFGRERIASRIAGRLVELRPPAQAIVGDLGSGKTSLLHLVADSLDKRGAINVKLVPIELWPFETANAAVQGVIRKLIETIAREVNVIGFRGIPTAYSEAMCAAGGVWSALARLQGIDSDPWQSLRTIDEVARTIGLRFVVWIEDLERFAPRKAASVSEERLQPIRALLYGLDQLEAVTVV